MTDSESDKEEKEEIKPNQNAPIELFKGFFSSRGKKKQLDLRINLEKNSEVG